MRILCLIFCAGLLRAEGVESSARRDPSVSYHAYLERSRDLARAAQPRFGKLSRASAAVDQATPYVGGRGLRPAPEWESEAVLQTRFELMRDARVFGATVVTAFARRVSWLYPDDGCFTRATLATQALGGAEPTARGPGKIFVFGNLSVATPNAPGGRAHWWYHVAPLIRVGDVNYALDPAIDARRPMTVDDWIAAQTDVPASVQVAVCGAGTYVPTDRCDLNALPAAAQPIADGLRLLKLEWDRLVELSRDPVAELGDRPPWR